MVVYMPGGERNVDAFLSEVFNVQSELSEENNNDKVDAEGENEVEAEGENQSEAKVEALFSPPLYRQRYSLVSQILTEAGVSRILDMGCNNCRFLQHVKSLPGVRYVGGLDIDRELLESEGRKLRPLPGDWLNRRKDPLVVELWHGSCGDLEAAMVLGGTGVQAVTSIELIEHLDPEVLATFSGTVLGVLKPRLWIVTTPNSEFNSLFPDFDGPFRHWDHRFEWTRAEFRAWVSAVLLEFPEYRVEYSGAGWREGKESSHGPCSQVVVFVREEGTGLQPDSSVDLSAGGWSLVLREDYPVVRREERSREEVLGDELSYYLRQLAWDRRGEETVLVHLEELLGFDGVSRITQDVEEVGRVLGERGLKVDTIKGVVVVEEEEREDSDESEEEGLCYEEQDVCDKEQDGRNEDQLEWC